MEPGLFLEYHKLNQKFIGIGGPDMIPFTVEQGNVPSQPQLELWKDHLPE